MVNATKTSGGEYKNVIRAERESAEVTKAHKLNIVPYSHTIDQEFALKSGVNPHGNYDDWGDVYCLWGNNSNRSEEKIGPDSVMGKIIAVRSDGFITDLTTGRVWYGDKESIELLLGILKQTVEQVKVDNPEIFTALNLNI